VTSSSSQGTVNMMSSAEQQFSVPLPPQQFYVPGTSQFVPMQGFPQYLATPTVTPQCHLGFLSVLTQESTFHVSQIEHEASN
jgi:hypothetical protein